MMTAREIRRKHKSTRSPTSPRTVTTSSPDRFRLQANLFKPALRHCGISYNSSSLGREKYSTDYNMCDSQVDKVYKLEEHVCVVSRGDDQPSDNKAMGSGETGTCSPEEFGRDRWKRKANFILVCIGHAVGLGNIWRFPYLAYKSGGGAFLIPYLVMLVLVDIPMLYMEFAFGQYFSVGPVGAFRKATPILKGTGVALVVTSFLLSTYFNVIMAWALFYLGASFVSPLPYGTCGNWWNTDDCVPLQDMAGASENVTSVMTLHFPTDEYFHRRVLQATDGIDDLGNLVWELFLLLICAWTIVYFCIWKGVKSSGRVVYFTVIFPYLVLLGLLVYVCTLPGAVGGIRHFLKPDWSILWKPSVWIEAAAQNFNSIGLGFGAHIAMSSYNKFKNDVFVDTVTVTAVNGITNLISSFTVFAILGLLTEMTGATSLDQMVTEGPGLVFVVVPMVFTEMPGGNVWSFLFFFMICCLAVDSQFAMSDVLITTIMDEFPGFVKKYLRRKELLVLLVVVASFLCGVPTMFQGGVYWFHLMDWHTAILAVLIIAPFEVAAICYFYGASRLSHNVKEMMGKLPNIYFRICWYVLSPVVTIIVFVVLIAWYDVVYIAHSDYAYPDWADVVGWLFTSLCVVWIPLGTVHALVTAKGKTKEKILSTLRPQTSERKPTSDLNGNDEEAQCGKRNIAVEDELTSTEICPIELTDIAQVVTVLEQ